MPTAFNDQGDHLAIGSKRLRQYTLTLGRFNLIKNLNLKILLLKEHLSIFLRFL